MPDEYYAIPTVEAPNYTQEARIQVRRFCEAHGIDPRRIEGYSALSTDEVIQSVVDLIGVNTCERCIFLCGDCGTCAITGYPPDPNWCRNENIIRKRFGLDRKEANL
ncbi:MAG: hypothetical protein LIO70_06910 [Clostridiales bacterium]|nr:hypothetical protein [Clostridiales bacterium]